MSTASHPTRWVAVDDTDPGIQYTGAWFQDPGTADGWGNQGPTFNSTQHGTISNASLSYTFKGSWVEVIGSENVRNDAGVIDPSWECFVDNVSIGVVRPVSVPMNSCRLCATFDLPDGLHVITVRATVRKAQIFWIDQLHYVPSPIVALDQKTVLVRSEDPHMEYSSGWETLDTYWNMTSQQGSTLTFDFIGVSLVWFGAFPGSRFPTGPSTATYSIDGQTPINIAINGSTKAIYYLKFFETSKLSPGPHRLSVVYTSPTNQSTPLVLNYLVIQNGTESFSGGSKSGSGSNAHIGPIVGGIVGGLALICLIIFGTILLRRKKKTGDNEASSSRIVEPDFAAPASPGNQSSLQPQVAQTGPNYAHTDLHQGHESMPSDGQTEFPFQSTAISSTPSGNTFPINPNSSNIVTQPSPSTLCPQYSVAKVRFCPVLDPLGPNREPNR